MPVVQLPTDLLRLGQPTPFALRDATGALLVAKGVVLTSEVQRQKLAERIVYVEESEGELVKRAMAGRVHAMMEENATLGRIAGAQVDLGSLVKPVEAKLPVDPPTAWTNLQMRASALLRDPLPADFLPRFARLQQDVLEQLNQDVDISLLVLVQASANDPHRYSSTHALLVTVLCELAGRNLPGWTDAQRETVRQAALSANLSMTALQDVLALQDGALSAQQRAQVDNHATRSVASLRKAGVVDACWLEAVENHHDTTPGPLTGMSPGLQMARLIERADIFAARLSSRKTRPAQAAAIAAKAAFLDERQQADQAGGAILKAVGLHPPGSFVKLVSGEIALVLRRGPQAKTPKVASVISRSGTPLGEPALRDTRLRAHEVAGSVAPGEVRVRLNLERLLKLA
jgi:hypothetical protein